MAEPQVIVYEIRETGCDGCLTLTRCLIMELRGDVPGTVALCAACCAFLSAMFQKDASQG